MVGYTDKQQVPDLLACDASKLARAFAVLPSFLPSAGQHTLDTNEETGTNAKAGDQQPRLTLAGFSKGGLLYCGPAMLHACILTVSKSNPGTGLGELSYIVSVE